MSAPAHEMAQRFVDAMRRHFVEQVGPTRLMRDPLVWVNAGVSNTGHAVLIYKPQEGGPLVGRRWDLDRLGPLFGTDDPEVLAEQMWLNEVEDPDVRGQRLDVDWAASLVDNPSEVLWLGEPSDYQDAEQ